MKKRRSDIQKLVTAAREIWRMSETHQQVKKDSRDPKRSGWFICGDCESSREVIKVDHKIPIGIQPIKMSDFGTWLQYLFCGIGNLKPICADCHKEKTKEENLKRREEKKRLKGEGKLCGS